MQYNFNFALGSVFFMGLTIFFYLRQNRIRDLQDRLFTVMLFGGLIAVVFDFIAAAVEPSAASVPRWLLYAMNSFFLLGEQICLPAFFLYTVSSAGHFRRLSSSQRFLSVLPFILVILLVAASPFGRFGIFYIDEYHIYRPGATHWLLYAVSVLYMLGSCTFLAFNYKAVERSKRLFIFSFVALLLCAVVFQMIYPKYLLATSATALALTAMYYLLRAPGEQEDPFTGALCRSVLAELMNDHYDAKRPFTLLLFTILNYNTLLRFYGSQLSDAFLAALAQWLKDANRGDLVVYMNDADFTIVIDGTLTEKQLHERRQQIPSTLTVDGSELPVKLAMAALYCYVGDSQEQSLTAMDFLFRKMRQEQREDIYIANEDFHSRCARLGLLEASMDRITSEGDVVLLSERIFSLDAPISSPPVILDISLGLLHEKLTDVTADELLMAVQQSGNTVWYYNNLVSLTGALAKQRDASVRFCIPLLPAILIQDDMAVRLFDRVAKAGLEPERIVLRFTEEDVSVELPVFRDNMRRLSAFGFGFCLGGFAEGYTDMSLLSTLPADMVMLDRSLIFHAVSGGRDQDLLVSVISILHDSGKIVICDGVDSSEAAHAAKAAGADLCRGQWCG